MFDALKKVNTAVHILHFQCKLFDIILYMLVHVFNKQLSKPVLFLVKCVIFLQFASDWKGSWQGNTKNLVLLSTIVLGSIVHSSSVFCFVVPDKSEKKSPYFNEEMAISYFNLTVLFWGICVVTCITIDEEPKGKSYQYL